MLLIISGTAFAQVTDDSIPSSQVDSVPPKRTQPDSPEKKEAIIQAPPVYTVPDSFSKKPIIPDSGWVAVPSVPLAQQVLNRHPYFGFNADAVRIIPVVKKSSREEVMFYSLIALLLFFAFLRNAFSKYFSNLFNFCT